MNGVHFMQATASRASLRWIALSMLLVPLLGAPARGDDALPAHTPGSLPEVNLTLESDPLLVLAADTDPPAATARGLNPWDEGAWTLYLYGSAAFGQDGDVYAGHIGIGYNIITDLTLSLEGVGAYIDGDAGSPDTELGGVDLIMRYHMWRGADWSLFVEGGIGIAGMSDEFPVGGTDWVLRPQVGTGFLFRVYDNVWMTSGIRWLHMSNADAEGEDRNPSYDAPMFYLGVTIPF